MAKYEEDYKTLMDEAASRGDFKAAAEYETLRNDKIDAGDGNGYAKTYSYTTPGGSYLQNETAATPEEIAAAKSTNTADSPSYLSASGSRSKYGSEISGLYKSILDRDPFTYDYTKDPVYQQYADQYTQAGDRAMQDTLGEVSARTGGLASSYAGAAAQGSYDSYMQQLAAKVPELYQLAYSMYQNEGDNRLANLGMLRGLQSDDYSQYNTDRAYNYGVYSDSRDFTAREAQQTKENQWYEEQVASGVKQQALQAAMSNSLSQAQWEAQKEQYIRTGKGGAAVANYETYFDYMTGLTNYYAAQLR
jgi:hypothetical protein